jgi:hypothetical protein
LIVFEPHGRPPAFWRERPRQSIHVHAEVVQAAETNIRRNRSHLQDVQNELALGFDDSLRQQPGKCLDVVKFKKYLQFELSNIKDTVKYG